MDFNFPPQTFPEFLGLLASMLILMAGFYFLGQWLHSAGFGPKMKSVADKMERIQERLSLRAFQDAREILAKLDKLRNWPFSQRK